MYLYIWCTVFGFFLEDERTTSSVDYINGLHAWGCSPGAGHWPGSRPRMKPFALQTEFILIVYNILHHSDFRTRSTRSSEVPGLLNCCLQPCIRVYERFSVVNFAWEQCRDHVHSVTCSMRTKLFRKPQTCPGLIMVLILASHNAMVFDSAGHLALIRLAAAVVVSNIISLNNPNTNLVS